MFHLQGLPTDVFLAILAWVDTPSQVALALTCHTFFDLVDRRAFDIIKFNPTARRELLASLERDLPTDVLYCPGCAALHLVPTTSSHHEPTAVSNAAKYADLWECIKFDQRNETREVYGSNFNFYQARMALKLYRLRHANRKTYLQSLFLAEQRSNKDHLFRREVRVAPSATNAGKFEMALRIQDWRIFSDKDLAKQRPELENYRQLLLCFHMSYRGGLDRTGLRMARKLRAAANAPDQKAADDILSSIRHAPLVGMCMQDVLTADTVLSEAIAYATPNHCFGPLYRCITCRTEHRTDVVRIPPLVDKDSSTRVSRGIAHLIPGKPKWAVVTTKWMCLGTLDAQNSWGWQGRAHVEPGAELCDRPDGVPQTGDMFALFEGRSYSSPKAHAKDVPGVQPYIPQWDHEMAMCA